MEVLEASQIPQTITEVKDDILDKAVKCEITGRPFRIILSELSFLRRMGIPLPTIHPSIRMQNRWVISPVGKKYKAICVKCKNKMETLFNPKEGMNLYCEKCYQQEVI
jgi:CxxC-x17-CxxC domain-containing protein